MDTERPKYIHILLTEFVNLKAFWVIVCLHVSSAMTKPLTQM